MLVLSRKLNQSIQVGENISITIVRVKGNVVQLGIEAPREVPVVRAELIARDARQAIAQAMQQQRSGLENESDAVSAAAGSAPTNLLAAS